MSLLAPSLLIGPRFQEPRGPRDGRRDTGQSAGVDVQEQTGQRRPGGCGGRGAVAAFDVGGGADWGAVRDPVVDEEGDSGVGEEMVGFTGGRVGGHDDGWEGVIGGRGEVGIGHE